MAPQAIEIAKNGRGDPPACDRREGESIRRIPYEAFCSQPETGAMTGLSQLEVILATHSSPFRLRLASQELLEPVDIVLAVLHV
jgi:hypothetical protein